MIKLSSFEQSLTNPLLPNTFCYRVSRISTNGCLSMFNPKFYKPNSSFRIVFTLSDATVLNGKS